MRKRGDEVRASIIGGRPAGCRLERPWREEQQFPAALQETPRKWKSHVVWAVALVHWWALRRIENQSHARPDPRRIIG
jgi:hypothetical protein